MLLTFTPQWFIAWSAFCAICGMAILFKTRRFWQANIGQQPSTTTAKESQ